MPTTPCFDCGGPVSLHALACPHCGRSMAPHAAPWVSVMVGVLVGGGILLVVSLVLFGATLAARPM